MMLIEEIKTKDIVLASRSPRRKELLSALGIDFRIMKPVVSEDYPPGMENERVAVYLAEKKANWVLERENKPDNNLIIIASDTIVCLDDMILNKPSGRQEAVEMISSLSGKMHFVITGVVLAGGSKQRSFYSETKVYFTKLQYEEIEYYVDHFRPYDKAGSYGIQEWIGYIGIDRIEGSYFNVMGLPVQRLYNELKSFIID